VQYLQVAISSQATIFITRAHGFFFSERPSAALVVAFLVAQTVATMIAKYADWGCVRVAALVG